MLSILLVFALIRTLHGVPLSSQSEAPDGFIDLDIRDTQVHFGQRGVNDIIVSCFVTIFACTWSAIHPNIPGPTDSEWTRFKRQVAIMIYALLAPEFIITWALDQYLAARRTMEEYNRVINGLDQDSEPVSENRKRSIFSIFNRGFGAVFSAVKELFEDPPFPPALAEGKGPRWSLAHGFFLQMGGFILAENGQPTQILTAESSPHYRETNFIWNIQNMVIDPPRITEEDIKDRTKGDTISKTLIVLQTTWFVTQCIARWSERLPVTELEVVTLGFAMLNGITYALWWNKPQNVGRPVFLESKKARGYHRIPVESSTTKEPPDCNSLPNVESNPHPNPSKKSWLRRKMKQEIERRAPLPTLLFRIPFRLLQAGLRPLKKMDNDRTVTKMRVGMFYSANRANGPNTAYATAAIGAILGSVHLIPSWFFDFPSRQEMWLWRASAIVITIEPIFMGVRAYTYSLNHKVLKSIFSYIVLSGLPFYIVSRIMLITISLTSLRSLPPAAFQTIEWTTFIPHL